MNQKEKDYIQLPALPRDMQKEAVGLLWEFVKLSPESQNRIKTELFLAEGRKSMNEEELLEFKKSISGYPEEDITEIQECLQQLISQIMIESCDMVVWVYERKYKYGMTINEMIAEYPSADKYIMTICTFLDSQEDLKSENKPLS